MGNYPYKNKRRITSEKAIQILKENEITATKVQAKEILNFLYLLADITVKDYQRQMTDITNIELFGAALRDSFSAQRTHSSLRALRLSPRGNRRVIELKMFI